MREIKFRAWDNISKRMHNHIGKVCDNGKAESREDIGALVDGQNSGHYILHDCILMQFTGLKDKNGVDIYEGDLLRNEDWIRDAHAYNTWDRVIEWDKNNACFLGVDGEVCEVIGNIYENPELLKNE